MDLVSEAVDDKAQVFRGTPRFHGTRHVELDELPRLNEEIERVQKDFLSNLMRLTMPA